MKAALVAVVVAVSVLMVFAGEGNTPNLEITPKPKPKPKPKPRATPRVLTTVPTLVPTTGGSDSPTLGPSTSNPTAAPTMVPTSSAPTLVPTSSVPTLVPTSSNPTGAPTTSGPTVAPTGGCKYSCAEGAGANCGSSNTDLDCRADLEGNTDTCTHIPGTTLISCSSNSDCSDGELCVIAVATWKSCGTVVCNDVDIPSKADLKLAEETEESVSSQNTMMWLAGVVATATIVLALVVASRFYKSDDQSFETVPVDSQHA